MFEQDAVGQELRQSHALLIDERDRIRADIEQMQATCISLLWMIDTVLQQPTSSLKLVQRATTLQQRNSEYHVLASTTNKLSFSSRVSVPTIVEI
eukprot:4064187-Amphidinium_carterae.1